MFRRLFVSSMSLGVASSLFLLIAIEVSTARSRTARNRLPMENGYRPQGRKILQLTEDKQHPWKRNALLGMAGQQKDVILQINKSVQDGISPVLTRGKRDVPKKKRKGGKRKHHKRRKRKHRGRQNVNGSNTGVRLLHCVPNINATEQIPRGRCEQLWGATVCGNKTMITSEPNYVLRFWTHPKTKIPERFAFGHQATIFPSGLTLVQQTGLYQLYTQILFLDDWFRTAVSIDVNGKPEFKCIHEVGGHGSRSRHDHFYNTCSINTSTYLKTNDTVEVKILYGQSAIDLHPDSTYFGIVLLST